MSRRRRGGIIGFGFIAEMGHVPALATSDELEIVAVADICPARRAVAAKVIPNARVYEGAAELLRGEGDGLDFVDITAPPYAHAAIACAALEHGLHVVCEKPIATNVESVQRMLAAAEARKRVLFAVENYKDAPVISAVSRVLEAGLIGTVHEVTLSTFRHTHARGVREWNENWRREKRYAGGGITMDHGSHTFYLAFEWLRSFPLSVSAKTVTRGPFDTEDTLIASVTFPTGLAAVHLTWNAGVRKVTYTIHGDRGAIRVEDDDVEIALRNETNGGPPGRYAWDLRTTKVASEWMDAGHAGWFRAMFPRFVRAMDEREILGPPVWNALRCMELVAAAYVSASDGSREHAVSRSG